MKKPYIGITPSFLTNSERFYLAVEYVNAIYRAGGIPVILPYSEIIDEADSYISSIDGLLLSGGGDVNPLFYKREPESAKRVAPERDEFEANLIKLTMKRKIPILGICRGAQILNIALGGDLIQDIKGGLEHWQEMDGSYPQHSIFIENNSLLYKILRKRRLYVNSFHHQAINRLGKGLVINARSKDGIIEGIENKDYPFLLGIQFHAELMWQKTPLFLRIFKSFVEKAKARILGHS